VRLKVRVMNKEKRRYDINLASLEDGRHTFRYDITQSFFDMFDFHDFDKAEINVKVVLVKNGNLMQFDMDSEGSVELPDDRTGHLYRQPLKGKYSFLLKYGEQFNDDNDEMIIIPYNQGLYNIAQQIYEMAVLSVPMKHLDPDYKEEKENNEPENAPEKESPQTAWKSRLAELKRQMENNSKKQ